MSYCKRGNFQGSYTYFTEGIYGLYFVKCDQVCKNRSYNCKTLKTCTVNAVIFEGSKFRGFHCKLAERKILIPEKEVVA